MTDQEYDELKERLYKDGLIVAMDKKAENSILERDYFHEAISYWKDNMQNFNHIRYATYQSMLTVWEHVRKLIYAHYGVKNLKQMKSEDKEEANKLGIDILKLIEKGNGECK